MKLKEKYLKFEEKARRIAQECNIEIPKAFYRYGIYVCWKCNKEIIVFAWPKDGMWDDKDPQYLPIPKTIKNLGSQTVGAKYWINTCPYCQSVQGDFFLYNEPDGPFFGIDFENDTPISYMKDMLGIAEYAEHMGLI